MVHFGISKSSQPKERYFVPVISLLARSGKFLASWTSTYFAGDRIEFLGTLLKSGYLRNPLNLEAHDKFRPTP
jgi:hypothetical protein